MIRIKNFRNMKFSGFFVMKRLAVTLWGPVKYDIIILIIQTYKVFSIKYIARDMSGSNWD